MTKKEYKNNRWLFRTIVNWRLIILVCLISGLTACEDNETGTPISGTVELTVAEATPVGEDLPFITLEQNDWGYGENLYGDFEDQGPALFAITRLEDIGLVGDWITPETRQKLQTINYDTDLVLVVFQGWKPSSDYGVQVEHITIKDGIVKVFAIFREPEPESETHATETSPYQVIQIPGNANWIRSTLFNLIVDGTIVASYVLDTSIEPTVVSYPPLVTPKSPYP